MTDSWTLSVWSDSPQDHAVVQSMLSLMQGGLTDHWSYGDAATADLLVLGKFSSRPPRLDEHDSYVVAQLTEPGITPLIESALKVSRPLRAMPFLDLLHEASIRLRAIAASPAFPSTDNAPLSVSPDRLQLIAGKALFELRHSRHRQPVAVIADDGSLMAMIDPERGAVASESSAAQLLDRIGQQFGRLQQHTNHTWDGAQSRWSLHALDGLCWQLGQKLGKQIGLAPWLQSTTPYRLISWPDFGAIGSDRIGFKLSAELSLKAMPADQLCQVSGVNPQVVASFLNSVSLCGLLVTAPDSAPAAPAARQPAPERLSMISRLRLKLGL